MAQRRHRDEVVQPRPGLRLPLRARRAQGPGSRTFILARPTKDKGPMAAHVDRSGVWDPEGVTEASDSKIRYEE